MFGLEKFVGRDFVGSCASLGFLESCWAEERANVLTVEGEFHDTCTIFAMSRSTKHIQPRAFCMPRYDVVPAEEGFLLTIRRRCHDFLRLQPPSNPMHTRKDNFCWL